VAVVTSPGFQSDAAAMTRAVQAFDTSSQNVRQTMSSLESDLQSVVGANSYQGAQAQAFWSLQQRLQEDMQVVQRELQNMSGLVHASQTNYSTGDEQAAQSLNSLSGQLGGGAGGAVIGRLGG
jgi:WXG100 family type VII secretion target